jgi:hypothetical protein
VVAAGWSVIYLLLNRGAAILGGMLPLIIAAFIGFLLVWSVGTLITSMGMAVIDRRFGVRNLVRVSTAACVLAAIVSAVARY